MRHIETRSTAKCVIIADCVTYSQSRTFALQLYIYCTVKCTLGECYALWGERERRAVVSVSNLRCWLSESCCRRVAPRMRSSGERTHVYIYNIYISIVTARPLSPQEGASLTLAPIIVTASPSSPQEGASLTFAPIIVTASPSSPQEGASLTLAPINI